MSVSSAPEGRAHARAQVQGETKKNRWRDPDLFTHLLDGNVMIRKKSILFPQRSNPVSNKGGVNVV